MPSTTKGRELVSQPEAAKRLGMQRQPLGVWARRPGAPVEYHDGKLWLVWPLFPRWRDGELVKQKRPVDLDEARRRKLVAEAEIAEMDAETKRGAMVPVTEVVERWGLITDQIRARLVNIPGRVAPLVADRPVIECQDVLQREVADILTDLQDQAA